ncbi:MAG: AMP-binding protein [Pseudomonadota bacterium]
MPDGSPATERLNALKSAYATSALALSRTIRSLVADELAHARNDRSLIPASLDWSGSARLDESGLGFDSLDIINAASRVNQFFRLHEVGVEDYLLLEGTVDKWADIVRQSLAMSFESLTFLTSGSTGEPKIQSHSFDSLARDAVFIRDRLKPSRILSLVPAHHIYGAIYTTLMPLVDGSECPVIDIRFMPAKSLRDLLSEGDLIVGTPFTLKAFARSIETFPAGVRALTSTAPMSNDLAQSLNDMGLETLLEVYGASETGGIGWRTGVGTPFRPFPWWSLDTNASTVTLLPEDLSQTPEPMVLQDRITAEADGCFSIAGRKDGGQQVGGVNVFPSKIEAYLNAQPGVAESAVRGTQPSNGATNRLKAFIVPESNEDASDLLGRLEAACRSDLSTPERPVHFTIGAEIPTNEIGKRLDWS